MKNTTLVEVHELKFNYSSKMVLHGVNLTVPTGEIIGLIGENGAGKTTLLKLLLGILHSQSGAIQWNKVAKPEVNTMFQNNLKLVGVTVRDLLQLTAAQYRNPRPVADVMEELALSSFAKRPLSRLSGGQLRKVAFGLTLVSNAQLLFLDEPTVGMDVNTRQIFWRKIEQMRVQGKTVLITSHYLAEIQEVADRILILKAGKIKFNGTLAELQRGYLTSQISFVTNLSKARFQGLPNVKQVLVKGQQVTLETTDSDQTLRALAPWLNQLNNVKITAASLENIFTAMTKEDDRHE
ncbi:ABC transporter ATP-binding protein [Pediococcus acidilactici]|uniref:ABC transporter ATP-binding protein n=1 Tax=Pediococcus acidilactici TaxID=1254 RepID=UPI00232F5189|nr:ABC transporter ATP-binding protein [Pediococcus acidilactici]MDB8859247.1 ABC transporter ATP-binding protein [Pediococcus acidilactici]MDB8860330.1 ABC transporter ATP-binding protein [Pediococcus acidilactici]MDB8862963.1 ABC transporter ATP-binding protein [Pediococcus acidilactici]MDB8867095.1 ABC transporter ATP-binding protein [Pediococcus acidilactici]WQS10854.1 ABC transporter ATP-binding protein [Pediococcus acidilactici]